MTHFEHTKCGKINIILRLNILEHTKDRYSFLFWTHKRRDKIGLEYFTILLHTIDTILVHTKEGSRGTDWAGIVRG